MTPLQYYFPYFFEIEDFNTSLKPFGLCCDIIYDQKNKMAKELVVIKKPFINFFSEPERLFTLPFHTRFMLHEGQLISWLTDYDCIQLTVTDLNNPKNSGKQLKIEFSTYQIGINKIETKPEISQLVTFVRSNNIKYDQVYYEQFLIVIINSGTIKLFPFDWFNKTSGDYGYVWPATCQFDFEANTLYGKGMRMSDFTIKLD